MKNYNRSSRTDLGVQVDQVVAFVFQIVAFALVIACFLAPSTGRAQDTGQIAGIVSDASGAVVPNAKVTVRNLGTNATRSTTSTASGAYLITNLTPATYEITVPAVSGFSPFRSAVEVTVGGRVTLDVKLAVTQSNTSVEVAAEGGVEVNTQTQELGQVVDQTQISQLPSLTRNPYDFVQISGNISSGDAGSNNQAQNGSTRGVGFSLNGQRSSGTEILLDGVENISVFGDAVGIQVPLDAVQEFSIITSNFQPQYGRASGGIVNVTTKGGSNRYHGTVYEFNRLSAYTSNTETNDQKGDAKGTYTRNQFGFEVGGPILKDKLFFMASTEWTRVRSAASLSGAIPTTQFLAQAPANIQAFFTAYGTNAPAYTTTLSNSDIGSPYTSLPADFPVFGVVNYHAPADAGGGLPQNTYNIVGRVDYSFSDKTQAFFRYVDYNQVVQPGADFASPYSQYNVGGTNKNQAYLLSVNHVFNSKFATTSKASFSRFNSENSYDSALQNVPTLFVSVNAAIGETAINLPGFYDTNPGNGGLPYGGPQNTVQFNQDANYVLGKHSFQAGGQILYIQDNNAYGAYAQAGEQLGSNKPLGLAALETGSLFEFEAAVNPNGALPCVKDQYTGLLTKTPACSITLPASSPAFARSERFHDWAAYAQDAWKATPRTTINYGVRYEYFGVQHNDNPNLDSNFFFGGDGTPSPQNIRTGTVLTSPNSPVGGLWKPQYGTVSPRIGFAYDVFGDGKTSVRGGYGISYERNFGNVTFNLIQNPPNYAVIVQNNVTVTNSNAGPLGASSGSVPLPPTSLRNVSQNIRTAQTQFYSLSVDRQLAPGTVVSVGYTGSRGIHLYDIKNYNGLGSGNALLGDPTIDPVNEMGAVPSLTRLNPQFSNINNRGSNGDSYYQGVNVQFQSSNLRHTGVSLVANYTYAHETDDLSTTFSETNNAFSLGYTNPFDPSLDHGPGDFDIRHRLVVAPIYRTPYFTGKKGLLAETLGGYEVTGIYTVHTGTPFTFFDSTNNFSGYNVARYTPADGAVPQHTFKGIAGGAQPLPNEPNTYLVGTLPTAVSFGNPNLLGASDWGPFPATMTARNAFRGPGLWGFDASLSKSFPIKEGISLEFRAEGYNILNHHDLFLQEYNNDVADGNPPQVLASKGGIGNNGGANDERRFGQFAAKINF